MIVWSMIVPSHRVVAAIILCALAPAGALRAQGSATPSYRGFAPGAPFSEFAARARAVAAADPLVCNTSRNTANLMECGVVIRDPRDGARFYVSAYVLEGRVALVSLGDSGGPSLVDIVRRDLTTHLGPGTATGVGTIEWVFDRRVVRLNWRGRGAQRWIFISMEDRDVTDRISRYVRRTR